MRRPRRVHIPHAAGDAASITTPFTLFDHTTESFDQHVGEIEAEIGDWAAQRPRAASRDGFAPPVLARFFRNCPNQCGADIPVCARLRGQTGMSAPHCHAPSLRQAGTATPCAGALSRELPCHPTPIAPRRPPSPPIGAGNRQHRHISAPVELKHHQSQIKNQKPTWRPWRLKRPSCLPAFLIQKTVAAPAPHMIQHAAPTFSHLRHAPKPAPSSAAPPRQKLL